MKSFIKFFSAFILLIFFSSFLIGGTSGNVPGLAADSILYKEILPRPLQRSTSFRGITIVVPDTTEWKVLGIRLKELLELNGATGVSMVVADRGSFRQVGRAIQYFWGILGIKSRWPGYMDYAYLMRMLFIPA